MKKLLSLFALLSLLAIGSRLANAATLIGGSTNNGNLDRTHADEIVPGFFLPKPDVWVYSGSRTISGPYRDGISSEPWAGPAPTPVTTDGNLNPPSPAGCGGPDCAVFFKPFTGNVTDGPANVHLSQIFPAVPGWEYTLEGWAGAEANYLGTTLFNINFLNGGGGLIISASLNVTPALFIPNGQPFNYKKFSVSSIAPIGTAFVEADVAMLGATANPAGGGQALVIDDFTFTGVPEPSTLLLLSVGAVSLLGRRNRAQR